MQQHKPKSIYISAREVQLEEEQMQLLLDYKTELLIDKDIAAATLVKIAEVNALLNAERLANEERAKRMLLEPAIKDVYIQNNLS